jgi:hypothetical protein
MLNEVKHPLKNRLNMASPEDDSYLRDSSLCHTRRIGGQNDSGDFWILNFDIV